MLDCTSSPVSSVTSRTAAAGASSPSSTRPPTGTHRCGPRPGLRRSKSTSQPSPDGRCRYVATVRTVAGSALVGSRRLLLTGTRVGVGLLLGRAGVTAAFLHGLGLLAAAAPVVCRVEAGALEVHRDRVEHLLDGAFAAHFAGLGRRVRHPLEDLEGVPVGTAVLVDRHGAEG